MLACVLVHACCYTFTFNMHAICCSVEPSACTPFSGACARSLSADTNVKPVACTSHACALSLSAGVDVDFCKGIMFIFPQISNISCDAISGCAKMSRLSTTRLSVARFLFAKSQVRHLSRQSCSDMACHRGNIFKVIFPLLAIDGCTIVYCQGSRRQSWLRHETTKKNAGSATRYSEMHISILHWGRKLL